MRDERGSATVIALGVITGLVALGVALTASLAAAATRTHAQHVADVAALAAAHEARNLRALGQWDPVRVCAQAHQVVGRNDLSLSACTLSARGHVTLTVSGGALLTAVEVRAAAGASHGTK